MGQASEQQLGTLQMLLPYDVHKAPHQHNVQVCLWVLMPVLPALLQLLCKQNRNESVRTWYRLTMASNTCSYGRVGCNASYDTSAPSRSDSGEYPIQHRTAEELYLLGVHVSLLTLATC